MRAKITRIDKLDGYQSKFYLELLGSGEKCQIVMPYQDYRVGQLISLYISAVPISNADYGYVYPKGTIGT